MNLRLDPILLLLALLCVGAVFLGGMVATAPQPLPPGLGAALFSGLGGQDVPTFSHALLGLLVGIGSIWMVATRRVVQLPQTRILASLLLFIGLVAASVLISKFQAASLATAAEWVLYGMTFLFAAAAMGRKQGPLLVAGTVFGSILYLATLGIREWKVSPDGWRIFALWTPNTQASIQIVGIFLGIGLLFSRIKEKPEETEARPKESLELGWLVPFFAVLGLFLMGFALLHTGSKGGILALAAALAFWVVSLGALKWTPKLLPWIGRLTIAAVALVCLVPGLVSKVPDTATLKVENQPTATGAVSRISDLGANSEQSVGFRKLLWISSYRVLRENPLGVGMGAFLYHSAQPGLITQTQTAHNTLLQLLTEAGPLALIALLAFLAFWMESVMRCSASEPKGRTILRLSVISAAVALLFHSATESNLYTFGLGILFFVLLAIGAQLSPDSVSPEYVPKPGKALACVVAVATSLLLLWMGWAEVAQANAKYALAQRDVEGARAAIGTLTSIAPEDGETWDLDVNLRTSPEDAMSDLRKAIDHGPLPRYFRALAQYQIAANDLDGAQSTLRESFRWDPNNLPAHLLMLKAIDGASHPEDLQAAAQQLIDIEKSPYFQIRSIPDIVPTETYSARLVLAKLVKDPNRKIQLLNEALAGYQEYLKHTVPMVKNSLTSDPSGALSPEPVEKVKSVLKDARATTDLLAETQKALGHSADAGDVERAGKDFDDALAIFVK